MICLALNETAQTFGGIAQMGERLNGIQEVIGSIPIISTKERHTLRCVFSFSLKSRLEPDSSTYPQED